MSISKEPHRTAATKTLAAEKQARLAAELRANLARRKAQARQVTESAPRGDKPRRGGGSAA